MLAERVRAVFEDWAKEEGWSETPMCQLERPADQAHGDYATPVCMQLAKVARRSPRTLAEQLRQRLLRDAELSPLVEKVEIAGPGFVNFTLSSKAYAQVIARMLDEGDQIGGGQTRPHPRLNLEFVSVNPNGPLHVGHGRYAAYGDALRRLLAFSGVNVATEFYINDFGRQMDRFGKSVAARYAQSFGVDLAVPADGYQGDYVKDVAAVIREELSDRWVQVLKSVAGAASESARVAFERVSETGASAATETMAPEDEFEESETEESDWPADTATVDALAFFRTRGCELMLEAMRTELCEFGVEFDCWFSESALHREGRLERVVERLLTSGEAYREGDAIWLRTTARGDDKDRVLIRSNGHPTYFAADIAYHENKLERGFEYLINIWGADHHGYVPRMKAAVEILAGGAGILEVIIGQLVNLMEQGELRQMSTRRGEMVTLRELIEAIGVDAARFFLVMRSQDQTLDLDLDLARQQSQENPVYYVQYAHARIASILRNAPDDLAAKVDESSKIFATPYERELIKRLESFSSMVQEAAERRAPHRVAAYAQDLAGDFHVFYKHCRVIGVEPGTASSRLAICLVTKRVVSRCLDLLGVGAPESM
ncbi:MAG: arginine--tRNA ligase [Actinobacteria bacterium]|nr:arginine--tRNA ligase [Actinomycetota bacterium]